MADTQHTSEVPARAASSIEEIEDVDEPPESQPKQTSFDKFQRTPIRRPADNSSLLTKAFMGQSDDDGANTHQLTLTSRRRRSMTSNVSFASTADLTSDTGLTSPCRTNTPSPPLPDMAILRLNNTDAVASKATRSPAVVEAAEPPKDAPRKRCIQFACAAKPQVQQPAPVPEPMIKAPSAQGSVRRPCIKFACPTRPASTQNTPPREMQHNAPRSPRANKAESSLTPRKTSTNPPSPRVSTARRLSDRPGVSRPKFLRANSKDLVKDGSQFHEFASGLTREADWIRQGPEVIHKLTINDTLTRENQIRRLGVEAEEEAELEEEEEEEDVDDEDDEGDDDDDEDDEDEDDDEEEEEEDEDADDSDLDVRDGYSTDEETGFAESDESDDNDGMVLWTPSHGGSTLRPKLEVPRLRRSSLDEPLSDSSAATSTGGSTHRPKAQRIQHRSDTPDLPDSTDFVCGTLDEDRPLEEAYMSCLAARRNEKLRVIPQDIDPSFPASDLDNDDEEERYNPVHHGSDSHVWMQGDMEDLHHDQSRRRRKSEHGHVSPKRCRSPPPKRRPSPPPPKARGRSPKPLFGRHSPRRARSPAPRAMTTPIASPRQGVSAKYHLAGRPGATQTKSLPRPGAVFSHLKQSRPKLPQRDDVQVVRSAIDIVKGLEKKRQRRKEKFHQKYCDRARRGHVQERKAQPGRGAERMKELGLLMAGKKEQCNYMLSV